MQVSTEPVSFAVAVWHLMAAFFLIFGLGMFVGYVLRGITDATAATIEKRRTLRARANG